MKKLEKLFESFLWESRLIVIAAVIISLVSSVAMFFMATVDAVYMIAHLTEYPSLTGEARFQLRSETITHVVELIDGYLLATVLLIFSMGLYELFISKIDKAEDAENASKVLVINSLDDLKARLAKVILMILIVKFFEYALEMTFSTPVDLLAFAAGIALIGLALYLSHLGEDRQSH
ncbi:MAG: YqhA family protein [Gammaproteobacteria bacterium]|nr:YqhA family protein [Gammaproteobacteria bacterium]MCW8909831.1 YqhA family protein [Gammaproteobacteria bacterium]MCW9005794.1 YqhA family protein [Gammaproteobacteria bacterium]